MKPWYAINARQLLDDRKAGLVPAGPVSVVLTGNTEPHPALYVKDDMPAERMDWRMLVNLEVWIWSDPSVPLGRLLRIARDIAAVRPKRLTIRFEVGADVHDVDVGHGLHQPAIADAAPIHDFTWAPMDLSLTPVGARLRAALVRQVPMWSAL